MMPRAAVLLIALGAPGLSSLVPADAAASVSIAATFDGLLHDSTTAAVVTAAESRAVWEDGRIYTYTHVHVSRAVAGELTTGGEAWVRTMGGVVGKVGQIVEGEAAFAPGDSSLLFLRPGPIGAYVVTDRGQGQYPVVVDDPKQVAHIVKSHSVGMLVAPRVVATAAAPRLAAEVLHGRPVDDVAQEIAAAWVSAHAR
ncbi:MAG TPA: hypothetical protein VK762_28750 [Polyangiaceae bacterium]|jgi:hypothetical protein|nr:hypothetical protein [Polyangiaceae bacterium]